MPLQNGFDRSYYLRDQGRFFNPRTHWKDDVELPPVEKDSGFYATRALADHAIEFLDEHSREHAARPFFVYLAFAAPHFPQRADRTSDQPLSYLPRYRAMSSGSA